MIKLPKPLATEGVWYPNGTDKPGVVGDCYTAEQMLQFRRDALEEAARECQDMKQECGEPDSMQACLNRQMMSCADAIRKLKETT